MLVDHLIGLLFPFFFFCGHFILKFECSWLPFNSVFTFWLSGFNYVLSGSIYFFLATDFCVSILSKISCCMCWLFSYPRCLEWPLTVKVKSDSLFFWNFLNYVIFSSTEDLGFMITPFSVLLIWWMGACYKTWKVFQWWAESILALI